MLQCRGFHILGIGWGLSVALLVPWRMSKGIGKLQRDILAALDSSTQSVAVITERVTGIAKPEPGYHWVSQSVWRALRNLEERKLVFARRDLKDSRCWGWSLRVV